MNDEYSSIRAYQHHGACLGQSTTCAYIGTSGMSFSIRRLGPLYKPAGRNGFQFQRTATVSRERGSLVIQLDSVLAKKRTQSRDNPHLLLTRGSCFRDISHKQVATRTKAISSDRTQTKIADKPERASTMRTSSTAMAPTPKVRANFSP